MLEQIGDVIYQTEEIESESRVVFDEETGEFKPFIHKVRTHHCFAQKLAIEGNNSVAVDTPLPLTVRLLDWQGSPLNDPLEVWVTARGVTITLELVEGVGEFDFASPVADVFEIQAQAARCDEGVMEVTVW